MSAPSLPRRLLGWLPLLVSAVLLGLIAWRFDGWALLSAARPGPLALALLLSLAANTGLGALRTWVLARGAGLPIPYPRALTLWTGLLPLRLIAPLESGHAVWALTLRRAFDLPWAQAIGLAVYEQLAALAATCALVAAGSLLIDPAHPMARWEVPALALAAAALFLADAPLLRALGRRLPRVRPFALTTRPLTPPAKLALFAVATLYQATDVIGFWLVASALGLPVDLPTAFALFPLVMLFVYIPISLAGFGLREHLVAWLLAGTLTFDEGIASGLLVDLVQVIAPALLGLALLRPVLSLLAPRRSAPSAGDLPPG